MTDLYVRKPYVATDYPTADQCKALRLIYGDEDGDRVAVLIEGRRRGGCGFGRFLSDYDRYLMSEGDRLLKRGLPTVDEAEQIVAGRETAAVVRFGLLIAMGLAVVFLIFSIKFV